MEGSLHRSGAEKSAGTHCVSHLIEEEERWGSILISFGWMGRWGSLRVEEGDSGG